MISIFDMKTLKKKSTVKCTSTPLEKSPQPTPLKLPPLKNPPFETPLKCQWKKNNLPPNSETLFKILQPAPPIYFIEKFFGRQVTMVQKVRKNDKKKLVHQKSIGF